MTADQWRIYVTDTNGTGWLAIAELEFRSVADTPETASGGSATASDSNGANGPGYAFDGDASSWWNTLHGTLPHWLAYDYGTPKSVVQVAIKPRTGYTADTPKDFDIQYHNGSSWVTAKSVTGYSGYSDGTYSTWDLENLLAAIDVSATVSGELTVVARLQGSLDATAAVSGTLTTPTLNLEAAVQGTATVAGALTTSYHTAEIAPADFLPRARALAKRCGAEIEATDLLPTATARGGFKISVSDFLPATDAHAVAGKSATVEASDFLPTVATRAGAKGVWRSLLPSVSAEGVKGSTATLSLKDLLPKTDATGYRTRQATVRARDLFPRLVAASLAGKTASAELSAFLPRLASAGVAGQSASIKASDFLPTMEVSAGRQHDGTSEVSDFLPTVYAEALRQGRFAVADESDLLRYRRPA